MATASSIDQLLAAPIAWRAFQGNAPLKAVLEDLQANILKGHGRDHTRHLFLRFTPSHAGQIRHLVGELAEAMPSALQQLVGTDRYRRTGVSGGPMLCFFLSASGYEALGIAAGKQPGDAAFAAGMKGRGSLLADPDAGRWDEPFMGQVDAMLLVADDTAAAAAAGTLLWRDRFAAAGAVVLGIDEGAAIRRPVAGQRVGIEHFGYVDGRSQPLFLQEDIDAEPHQVWDPAFAPAQFLVADPGGAAATSLGSYFVFRKLEQNVKGFKEAEDALGVALGLTGEDAERAGAMVVGRFEDGTPLVLAASAKDEAPMNDFDFAADPRGERCPFRAHIRKVNPRGESPAFLKKNLGIDTTVAEERAHIMARRGISYGSRMVDADGVPADRPVGGVGLLFMAYMHDVAAQFEFTQGSWANNKDFVDNWTGIDPIIGQTTQVRPLAWQDGRPGDDGRTGHKAAEVDFAHFVTLKGGEYFFAPSLSFLRGL